MKLHQHISSTYVRHRKYLFNLFCFKSIIKSDSIQQYIVWNHQLFDTMYYY